MSRAEQSVRKWTDEQQLLQLYGSDERRVNLRLGLETFLKLHLVAMHSAKSRTACAEELLQGAVEDAWAALGEPPFPDPDSL